ncbi:MAG: hypothetical protein ACI8P9_001681 [Parasphingorhabdus sp.]
MFLELLGSQNMKLMGFKNVLALGITGLMLSLGFSADIVASTRTVALPLVTETIAGVTVQFPASGDFTIRSNCRVLDAKLNISLQELSDRLLTILKRSGIEQNHKCGDKTSIQNATMHRSGSHLKVVIKGNIGREECVFAKVPEINGFSVTFKERLIANTTLESNASVSAEMQPVIDKNNALSLTLIKKPHIYVENEAYEYLISALGFQREIHANLAQNIQSIIKSNQQWVKLPPSLAPFGVSLSNAQIVLNKSGLALQLDGHISIPPYLAPTTLSLLGFSRNACVKTG